MDPRISIIITAITILNISLSFGKSAINIQNNGYGGIVVAFHPDIPEIDGKPLIPKIQELFKNGSTTLFKSTRNLVYFKEVTILVPQKWTTEKHYTRATSENFFSADVRVDAPNPQYGDGPYTLQPLPCGKPGLYIHLTPNYLKYLESNSTTFFGDPGKTLVHEWAHLRYGIFDEFGQFKQPQFPLFYYDSDADKVLPNSCSDKTLKGKYWDLTGNDNSCNFVNGMPDENCIFIPDLISNKATTSIASYHFLPNVHYFCDKEVHNRRAPNKQNILCNYRSTWEVISNHSDFQNNYISNVSQIPNLEPVFTIVQQMEDTFSVVLDVSSSMSTMINTYSRLKMAADTIQRWLQEEVKEGSAVGIITFSTNTIYKGTTIKVTDKNSRDQLIQQIPRQPSGWTCIGCGLRDAITQLLKYRGTNGGTIILLTDGEENQPPYIKDIQDQLITAKIRVNTIAFTAAADPKITQLADLTGGKAYFVKEGDLQALGSAFYDAITYQTADFDLPVKIADDVYDTSSNNQLIINGAFSIDNTIGNSTTINFQYFVANDIQNITIYTSNFTVSMGDANNDQHQIMIDPLTKNNQFQFKYLKPGKYNYTIKRNGQNNQKITVSVMSKAGVGNVPPITTRCWAELQVVRNKKIISILAEVKQGNNPVINAAVVAKVDRPDGKSTLVQLFDTGNGDPDITKNDGIYSGYFKKFNGKGNYAIKAQVAGEGKTSIQEMGFVASQSMPIVNKYMASFNVTTKPTGPFERTAAGGTIQLNEDIFEDTTDTTPPGRILNLQVSNSSSYDFSVTLKWTAPGDDFDQGNASYYELRYSTDWDDLVDHFNGTSINIDLIPSSPGTDEQVTVRVPNAVISWTYFFAVKAYDKVNLSSLTSNVAQVTFVSLPTKTPTTQKPAEWNPWKWINDVIKDILDFLKGLF